MSGLKSCLKRLSVYGDLWTRLLNWGVSLCPWFLEPIFVLGYTAIFFIICSPPRRAVMANLQAIHPEWSQFQLWKGAFCVFRNYAINQVHMCRATLQPDCLSWKVSGVQSLERVCEHQGGLIVMTAHMGNYDVAAPFFAEHFKRKLHSIRAPEREVENQKLRESERNKVESEMFTTLYNKPDSMLALELTQILNRGEAVAIQGDRVLFDVSPLWVPFSDDLEWKLPKGPLVLALLTQAPIFPVFIWCREKSAYVIEIFSMQSFRRERFEADQEGRRSVESMDEAIARAAGFWSNCLKSMVTQHWDQWYVFESMFRPRQSKQHQSGGDACV